MRRCLCNVEDEAVKNTQVHDVLPRRAVQTSLDVGAGDEAGPTRGALQMRHLTVQL